MKHITIILICILTSCNSTFDRKNATDISKKLIKAVTKNDTTALHELFSSDMNSIETSLKESIFESMKFYEGKNAKYLKTDSSSYELWGKTNYILYSYFRIDTSYFRLNSGYELDENGDISLNSIYFANLSNQCSEAVTKPYCPTHLVDFRRISWQTDYSNKTFISAKVEFVNKSESDMDFVKFRVVLKNNGETFFNQTIVSNQKVFAGDFVTIDIPGLANYYAGFLINKNNIQFSGELIEVLPKLESNECKTISELKLLN